MKRQVFEVNGIRLWGTFPRDNVVFLNAAGTEIGPSQVKAIGKLKTPDGTVYDVNDAIDPWEGTKHINKGKFVEVYLKGGIAPQTSGRPRETKPQKRSSDIA